MIAAGSTGSIPATAELLAAIARLPQGAVVLPGLDRGLDDESWAALDPGHPQFGLAQLLRTFDIVREDVKDWFDVKINPAREILLSETLRPAPTTDAWRDLAEQGGDDIRQGIKAWRSPKPRIRHRKRSPSRLPCARRWKHRNGLPPW